MDTMRNRTTFLLLLAILLAIAPIVQKNQSESNCEIQNGASNDDGFLGLFGFNSEGGANPCADLPQSATPTWATGLGILSAVCFGACFYTAFVRWRDRRREREMLQSAGVEINYGDPSD
jgi:hypothetical protein